jgi:DUF1365 family protein
MPMACSYRFHIEPPGDKVLVRIDESDAEGPLLIASFSGRREPMSDRSLMRALIRYPLMTLKVTVGIHIEALRIWWKGIPVHRHRSATNRVATTIVVGKISGQEHP